MLRRPLSFALVHSPLPAPRAAGRSPLPRSQPPPRRRPRAAALTAYSPLSLGAALPLATVPPSAFEAFARTRAYASPAPPSPAAAYAALAVPADATVADAVAFLRALGAAAAADAGAAPDLVFVVGGGELLGHVPLGELLMAGEESGARVGDLARANAVVAAPGDSVAHVARLIAAAGAAAVPVVEAGVLVGVVRAADVARLVAGAGDAPYFDTGVETMIASRAPWLVGLLILQSASSWILGHFGGLIQRNVLLAFFLTTVVGAGGNSGSQSAAMLIVGLARGEVDERKDFWRVLGREMLVAVALGGILSCVAFLRVLILGGGTSETALLSSFTIALALLLTVVCASVMASATPMLLKRAGVDPALGSGPALSTLTDICGVLVLCFTASILLAGP